MLKLKCDCAWCKARTAQEFEAITANAFSRDEAREMVAGLTADYPMSQLTKFAGITNSSASPTNQEDDGA